MLKKTDLYPQTIYQAEYKDDLNLLIDKIYSIQKSEPNRIREFPKELVYQTSFRLFEEHFEFIKIKNYLKSIVTSQIDPNLKIYDSWANIYSKHGYSVYHDHSPSAISGVVYLQTFKGDFLRIHDKYGTSGVNIKVKNGDIVLFKGDQPHSTFPNPLNDNKIVIAFNFNF